MLLRLLTVTFALTCAFTHASSQTITSDTISPKTNSSPTAAPKSSKWYEKLSLRGYAQFRYNRLLETNPKLKCEQCDKGIGENQTFQFRRARLIFSGDVHERLFTYIQFDYSSDASSTNRHFLQVRDAYFDLAFDKKKEFRLRFGQSKVPFGFENMQSSSNRLPLDRADPLNSAVPNERDFGAFFYYAPAKTREFYKNYSNDAMKGTGDYGVFAFGLYNGQTTNKPELNDDLHVVARLSYPFKVGNQIIEPGIQAYTGKFTLSKELVSSGAKAVENLTYIDRRMAATIVLYQQPFGILAEYNIGESPSFDAASDSIQVQKLNGGFVTASYRSKLGKGYITPYTRYQVFDGAKKHELDARRYDMNELEIGVEWLPFKNLEVTLAYVISNRKYSDYKTDYDERGNFLRIQMQANY
ncbi:MAG: porin [Saprospiraceae bacterium]